MKILQVGSLALIISPGLDWCNLGRLVRVVGFDPVAGEWVVETLGRPLKVSRKGLATWRGVRGYKEETLASLGQQWKREEEKI
jgi:hypothetical protein